MTGFIIWFDTSDFLSDPGLVIIVLDWRHSFIQDSRHKSGPGRTGSFYANPRLHSTTLVLESPSFSSVERSLQFAAGVENGQILWESTPRVLRLRPLFELLTGLPPLLSLLFVRRGVLLLRPLRPGSAYLCMLQQLELYVGLQADISPLGQLMFPAKLLSNGLGVILRVYGQTALLS